MKDDKSYPYLYLSDHLFPRLDFYRGARNLKGHYFGPYPSAGAVRDTLHLVQKLFKLRQCSDIYFQHRTRPCLQHQIDRCSAPCVLKVDEKAYAEQVELASLFLKGKNEQVVEELIKKMDTASEKLAYEKAAHYRDVIQRIRQLQLHQAMVSQEGDVDILGCAQEEDILAVSILFVRAGRVLGQKVYFLNLPGNASLSSALGDFISQYYLNRQKGEMIPDKIILQDKLLDKNWIEEALSEALNKSFKIQTRKTPVAKKWLSLAKENAVYALSQKINENNQFNKKIQALQETLGLTDSLGKIECFDVSHHLGEATVASCVAFGPEGPLYSDYRRYNIHQVKAGDDYAALRQALEKRYKKMSHSVSVAPSLLMIDGGKGQLRVAVETLGALEIGMITVMAIAKGAERKPGKETLWVAGRESPLQLETFSPAFHFIQQIRDEAHRFAITTHRKKSRLARKTSPLENIPGIGAKRRQLLLRYFGGLQGLQQASVDDIAKIKGINQNLAKKIVDALSDSQK